MQVTRQEPLHAQQRITGDRPSTPVRSQKTAIEASQDDGRWQAFTASQLAKGSTVSGGVSAKGVLTGKALDPLGVPTKLYIGGEWVAPEGNRTLKVYDPATERLLFRCPAASRRDVAKAVSAARAAFDSGIWSKKSGAERAVYLEAIAKGLRDRQEELAKLESRNQGKPLAEAMADIDYSAYTFEYCAKLARELDGKQNQVLELRDKTLESKVRKVPVGVAAAIVPWNYPLMMAAWHIAPALAAGCTAVLKPSEVTPITALKLAEIAEEIGLPAGVLNVVPGTGKEAGSALAKARDVDHIGFTGGEVTGRRVRLAAAETGAAAETELGGKSPIVVFNDADIEQAAQWAAFGVFGNQGEVCSATSRLIVHEDVAPKLIARLVEIAKSIKIGPGLQDGVQMGPLVSKAHYEKVLSLIETGKREGATLLCGGGPTDHESGYFVQPTIFADVTPDMTIWQKEIFGPVLCVTTFRTEEEAVRLANHDRYDLAGAIFTQDDDRFSRVRDQIRATTVWQNCSQPVDADGPPWGGLGKSGRGRQLGPEALEPYLTTISDNKFVGKDPVVFYQVD